ncbi:glycerol ethanol, ferric requiring protein [Linderina pennispora]|nr:glycerol ethanol, ferric requiring protein [Linderina pennispora]
MDVQMLPANGIQYSELRQLLDDTQNIKGFPVVDNVHDVRLVGYVQRDALVRALLSVQTAGDTAMFSFGGSSSGESTIETSPYTAEATLDSDLQHPSSVTNLSSLVNTSPITVSPRTAADTVLEIFRKLGPRVILVENEDGQLAGLLTRKDVLRHVRRLHDEENASEQRAAHDGYSQL